MISQGFPLWARCTDGHTYAVVGWDVRESISYPVLSPLESSGPSRGAVASGPDDTELFTFTTTDPSAADPGVDYEADSRRLADLIGRMVRLADDLDNVTNGSPFARRIREELAQ